MDDRDSELGRRLHGAYERMALSPEAEERMLTDLLAHANAHAPAGRHQAARGQAAARPTRRLRKAVLPLAACLVLLAGVGVFAAGGGPRAETPTIPLPRPMQAHQAPYPSRAPSPSRTSPLPSRAAVEPTTLPTAMRAIRSCGFPPES